MINKLINVYRSTKLYGNEDFIIINLTNSLQFIHASCVCRFHVLKNDFTISFGFNVCISQNVALNLYKQAALCCQFYYITLDICIVCELHLVHTYIIQYTREWSYWQIYSVNQISSQGKVVQSWESRSCEDLLCNNARKGRTSTNNEATPTTTGLCLTLNRTGESCGWENVVNKGSGREDYVLLMKWEIVSRLLESGDGKGGTRRNKAEQLQVNHCPKIYY